MREDAAERSARYLETATQSLQRLSRRKLPSTVSRNQVDHVLDLVRGYTNDAKHYVENKKPVTSLACVAYAEGLLDALRFLQLIDL